VLAWPRKYDPLSDYLAAQPPGTETLTLTLAEIEAIIGGPLPPRVRAPAFWTNRSRRLFTAQPGMQAGWWMVRTERTARCRRCTSCG
jgi:hypothetical protein